MSTIPEAVRDRVRQRAGDRCEYCLSPQALVMGRLQVDHVLPRAKGGSNAEDNLCLACDLKQGQMLYQQAIAILEPKLGAEHPWTVRCREN